MMDDSEKKGQCHVKYKRVLLKLSGEALLGEQPFGLDQKVVARVASDIKAVHDMNVEICIVIGGGNIFRGVAGAAQGIAQATADYMGMLATVINALSMQAALEKEGVDTRVMSAIPMATVCEPYIRRRAIRHMEKGRVVIFAAGTGNPFFTTDTAASLRASEMDCNVLMKATKVDGIYSADPFKDKNATRFEKLSFAQVIANDLKVMDTSAIALARDNNIPIIVFSLDTTGEFGRVVDGKGHFTIVE